MMTVGAQQPADSAAGQIPRFMPLPRDAVKVFPNPVVSDLYLTVRMPDLRIRAVFLYDKDGTRVLEHRTINILGAPLKLNVSHLPAGKYYLVIETNLQPVRMQLWKQ